jgi:hypothetical protein
MSAWASILSEFSKEQSSALHKQNQFIQFKRPDGDEEIRIKLDGWHCMKRVDHFTLIFFFQKTI